MNSARFEVERSFGGAAFTAIGTVAAQGGKAAPTDYTYLDADVPAGQLYYRLRQVDLNGTATYSLVRAVTVGEQSALALFPNPTSGTATLTGAEPGPWCRCSTR